MSKWNVVLSTTEPHNYIGIVKVRQGNKNSEILEAQIVENGLPFDLSGCKVYFESIVGGKYPVQLASKTIDAKQGKIQYTFDEYSMQCLHRQTADFIIYKGEDIVATTQDFTYFVINAVSKTEGEMGSYWQSVEDLIEDMRDYINSGQDDFDAWFESIKEILAGIDPGGKLLLELMEARVDLQGVKHNSISERLKADFLYLQEQLTDQIENMKQAHYTLHAFDVSTLTILQDDNFSKNHETEIVNTIEEEIARGALVIANIDNSIFELEKVGELNA
ncbi:phage baseplate upper protein [Enterococcus montenegrensis]|uniref:phage baseplate upper protein n=1 Tax=Enterococcus montenegrensis TaxID=3031993 RepID=UPI00249DED9E|nr:phage baseplate upper protein [Enterococcus montenegrensis]WHA08801.1 phage baseplate upper protein [Enterococcus montenegrensis]